MNFKIQGFAADLFKIILVRVAKILKGARTRIFNVVHDDIQFYWHKDEMQLLKPVREAIEDWNLRVPVKCDISYSTTNWAEKKKLALN